MCRPRTTSTPRGNAATRTGSASARPGSAVAKRCSERPALADALEQSQAQADTVADRLRREADRVTRKTEWLSQLDRHRAARAAQHQDRASRSDRLDALRAEWTAMVGPLDIPAATPAELRAWLRRRDEVVQLAVQAHAAQQVLEPLDQSRGDHRKALERCRGRAGGVVARGRRSPLRLAGVGRRRRRTRGEDARIRDKHRSQADDARGDLIREQLGLKAAEDELAAWRMRWAEMMERLGLEPGAAPEQAEVILDKTQKLFETLHEYRDFQSRIRGIDRDAEQFAADVGDLARRVAADLAGQPADAQARELSRRFGEALAVSERHQGLSKQRDAEERRLRAAENERDTARMRLESLCREAGVDCTRRPRRSRASLGRAGPARG